MGAEEKPAVISNSLNCKSCGAILHYEPGTHQLKCDHCGSTNEISSESDDHEIKAFNYDEFLDSIQNAQISDSLQSVKCNNCGSVTVLAQNVTAGKCSFCASPLVIDLSTDQRYVKPHYVLPFVITQEQAKQEFKQWLKQLSFAPADLIQQADSSSGSPLDGVYLPYWVYDVDAITNYNGERGVYYWETETYFETVDGEEQEMTREVRRTSWFPVFGTVTNFFRNIVIPASKSLPVKTVNKLGGWDFNKLENYDERYVSGFRSETYQVTPEEGLGLAQASLAPEINRTIRMDIGGDEQQIMNSSTELQDINIKYILLPVWISSYTYKNKPFQFTINACTGQVSGARPWSPGKIIMWVVIILAIIAGLIYFFGKHHN